METPPKQPPLAERAVETLLFGSRWLLAPLYLGLSLAIVAVGVKFYQKLFGILTEIVELEVAELILVVLTLVDLSLVAGLLVMVMFSGYETFVSRIDATIKEREALPWLGKLDVGGLKLKIATSIVAISSIHLLKVFMDAEHIANDKLMWYAIIHIVFVSSAFLLALSERLVTKH